LQNKKKSKVIIVILSVLLAIVVTFGAVFGILAYNYSSYNWSLRLIKKYYYYGISDIEGVDGDPALLASKYLDKYSAFYTAKQYKAIASSNAGSKSGSGISYGFVAGKGVYVSKVVYNSPAYISGLRAGEYITGVSVGDGEKVEITTLSDFTSQVAGLDSGVDFTLYSDDSSYTMAKSDYTASYTYLATNSTSWHFESAVNGGLVAVEDTTDCMSFLPDGMGYIRVSQFYGTAASEFLLLVKKFNALNCTSLILDLRSNGGGYVDIMCRMAGVFSGGEQKVAMVAKDKNGKTTKTYCSAISDETKRISSDVDVYVLANSNTASASEAMIGAMVCYGALKTENIFLSDYSDEFLNYYYGTGTVKNARTYGKGIMQTTYKNVFTGVAIKLTTAKVYWPDGETCIHDDNDGNGGGVNTSMGCRTVKCDWEFTKGDTELKSVVNVLKNQ
jgi:C-terminal processing protease CtpA/Prc